MSKEFRYVDWGDVYKIYGLDLDPLVIYFGI